MLTKCKNYIQLDLLKKWKGQRVDSKEIKKCHNLEFKIFPITSKTKKGCTVKKLIKDTSFKLHYIHQRIQDGGSIKIAKSFQLLTSFDKNSDIKVPNLFLIHVTK